MMMMMVVVKLVGDDGSIESNDGDEVGDDRCWRVGCNFGL